MGRAGAQGGNRDVFLDVAAEIGDAGFAIAGVVGFAAIAPFPSHQRDAGTIHGVVVDMDVAGDAQHAGQAGDVVAVAEKMMHFHQRGPVAAQQPRQSGEFGGNGETQIWETAIDFAHHAKAGAIGLVAGFREHGAEHDGPPAFRAQRGAAGLHDALHPAAALMGDQNGGAALDRPSRQRAISSRRRAPASGSSCWKAAIRA